MSRELLLGDEAAAQGAIDAGIGGAFSYPGTPATEIFEYVESQAQQMAAGCGISTRWSANEKVAYEEALGMSYAGRRALVSMKHVGLNVAADAFMSSAVTGVNAGLVLVVGDDPGMHSSQNEQDTRFYQEFAQLPLFEPGNQQEAYDQVFEAFEYSEAVGLPVIVRMVTRLCHSRATVERRDEGVRSEARRHAYARPSPSDWVLVPSHARRRYAHLLELQPRLERDSEQSGYNRLSLRGRRGIITAGIARNYVEEAFGGRTGDSTLHIGHYPLPGGLIRTLVGHCEEVLVIEEGYPFIERRLNGVMGVPGKTIRGKLTGDLPPAGELTPDSVAWMLGAAVGSGVTGELTGLADRPPQLCRGCPHADSFRAMVEAAAGHPEAHMFSDIGCYALGVAPPFRAVHTCVDMGASISMAHGASQAGAHPVLCTIGDSTFAHSGMTGLLGAAHADANMTVIILDNATVGMTGTQDSLLCGEALVAAVRGVGVHEDHLHVIEPFPKNHEANTDLIRREMNHRGLSVIVARRPCIHIRRKGPASAQGGTCDAGAVCGCVTINAT